MTLSRKVVHNDMEGNTSRLNNPVVDKKMKNIVWANEIIMNVRIIDSPLSLNQASYISY